MGVIRLSWNMWFSVALISESENIFNHLKSEANWTVWIIYSRGDGEQHIFYHSFVYLSFRVHDDTKAKVWTKHSDIKIIQTWVPQLGGIDGRDDPRVGSTKHGTEKKV